MQPNSTFNTITFNREDDKDDTIKRVDSAFKYFLVKLVDLPMNLIEIELLFKTFDTMFQYDRTEYDEKICKMGMVLRTSLILNGLIVSNNNKTVHPETLYDGKIIIQCLIEYFKQKSCLDNKDNISNVITLESDVYEIYKSDDSFKEYYNNNSIEPALTERQKFIKRIFSRHLTSGNVKKCEHGICKLINTFDDNIIYHHFLVPLISYYHVNIQYDNLNKSSSQILSDVLRYVNNFNTSPGEVIRI